jgi:peroxiredoxin
VTHVTHRRVTHVTHRRALLRRVRGTGLRELGLFGKVSARSRRLRMALAYSKGMQLGTQAPGFSLPGVDGKTHTLESFADAVVLVVVFTCNHCPYAKAVEDRLIQLQRDYQPKGVRLVAINPNDDRAYPDDSMPHMIERAAQKGFNFPYLRDESQSVARAYDAACTPDIFVFDAARKLIYNGRFDDNWQESGKVRRQDLRAAIDACLAGRAIDFEPVPSMGCSIKWKGR